jgi:hypothetical protein
VADESPVASTSQQVDGVVASTAGDEPDREERTSAITSSARDEHLPARQPSEVVETTTERQRAPPSIAEDPLILNDGQLADHLSTVYPDDNTTFLPDDAFGFGDQNAGIEFPDVYDAELFGISPEASFGGWPTVSAEAASKWWFDLLAADTSNNHRLGLNNTILNEDYDITTDKRVEEPSNGSLIQTARIDQSMTDNAQNEVILTDMEIQLLEHYVSHLSGWIDITDPDRRFAIIVPELAMKNQGLASAILALSSLHLSLGTGSRPLRNQADRDGLLSASPNTVQGSSSAERRCKHSSLQIDPTMPVQYYNETLHYLQQAMGSPAFLRSDELLATVLIISTFEMIETPELGVCVGQALERSVLDSALASDTRRVSRSEAAYMVVVATAGHLRRVQEETADPELLQGNSSVRDAQLLGTGGSGGLLTRAVRELCEHQRRREWTS